MENKIKETEKEIEHMKVLKEGVNVNFIKTIEELIKKIENQKKIKTDVKDNN